MNREYIIQTGLVVAGCFLVGLIAIQYALDAVTGVSQAEPVLYGEVVSASEEDKPTVSVATDTDKDLYAKHLTSIADPLAGCGCPSCCAARPS